MLGSRFVVAPLIGSLTEEVSNMSQAAEITRDSASLPLAFTWGQEASSANVDSTQVFEGLSQ